jgi:hypothetical protein
MDIRTRDGILNFQGAQESIPPACVAWWFGTKTLFLLASYFLAPIDCSKIPALANRGKIYFFLKMKGRATKLVK